MHCPASSRWSTTAGAARSSPRAGRTITSTSRGSGPSTSSTRPAPAGTRGEAGTCFGSISLLGANPSTFVVTTIEDTLTLVMDAETFVRLRRDYRDFEHFFDEQRAHRMRRAVGTQQLSTTGAAILKTQARELLNRELITTTTRASIQDAARAMSRGNESALLVMDGERLAGIVTDRDLRSRVLATGLDPQQPVTEIMTRFPVTGGADMLAFEIPLETVDATSTTCPFSRGASRSASSRPPTSCASSRPTRSTLSATSAGRRTSRASRRSPNGSGRSSSRWSPRTPRPTTSGGLSPPSATGRTDACSPWPRNSSARRRSRTAGYPWARGPAWSRPWPRTRTTRSSSRTTCNPSTRHTSRPWPAT